MKCEKCGVELDENNICPKCGRKPEDEQISDTSEQEIIETETKVDVESLENLEVNFDEVDGLEDSEQQSVENDDFKASNDELVIDFDEINHNVKNTNDKRNNSSWLVAFVSFIAGVLATLITIGCFNGTIINYFDRITNGSPKECVENFCKFYYQSDIDAKKMTEAFSPYVREMLVNDLKSYVEYSKVPIDINLDIDVTKDSEFEKIAEYYLDLVTSSSTQKVSITNLNINNIDYYKSGTDEFNSYLSEYKSSSNDKVSKAEGVSVFAKVAFKVNCTVESIPQATTVTEQQTTTNKKGSGNKKDTTTATTKTETTEQTTSSVQEASKECVVICVKINDKWQVFNGMQTTDSAQ